MRMRPDYLKWVGTSILDLIRRTRPIERSILLTFVIASTYLFIFIKLVEEIFEGDTKQFDKNVLLLFRNPANLSDTIGPPWLEETMRDFTALGGIPVLVTIALAVIGFLFITKKSHAAWMVCWSVSGGMLVSSLLKWLFSRPRPDLVPHAAVVYTHSFPSGHAMLSAVVYLTLGALLARTHSDVRAKLYLLGVAALLTVLVGISRIYLGVHWPTDVLGGWAVGSSWALFCWLVMLWLQGRGKVESPSLDTQREQMH
jgi:undecaprenyl-diphosphatase